VTNNRDPMNDAMRRLWPVASVAVLALLYV